MRWDLGLRAHILKTMLCTTLSHCSTSTDHGFMDFLYLLGNRLSSDMNRELFQDFTVEEVYQAHKHIDPHKASGLNGLTRLFYQRYWHIAGVSVTQVVLSSLNIGMIPSGLNHTHIVLFPKKENPVKVADFCPISICNVIYKLIYNSITNRLKMFLPSLISKSQSAFVPGRQISDNILIVYELIHFFRRKKKGKRVLYH